MGPLGAAGGSLARRNDAPMAQLALTRGPHGASKSGERGESDVYVTKFAATAPRMRGVSLRMLQIQTKTL